MTQAQILQAEMMTLFWNRLTDFSDSELMHHKWIAEETQDGKQIRAIKREMNRRIREA
jgi:hypothetical protein